MSTTCTIADPTPTSAVEPLHGYTHTDRSKQSSEQEREELEKSVELLKGFGVTPRGYRSPAWELSTNTLALLGEFGIEYSSNYMDDIRPYKHPAAAISSNCPFSGFSTMRLSSCSPYPIGTRPLSRPVESWGPGAPSSQASTRWAAPLC